MAWLGTWSNRIKCTIDYERIDADLTNFPVLVTLISGTGSGRNNFNAAPIFEELGYTTSGMVFEDDFSDGLGTNWENFSGQQAIYTSYRQNVTWDTDTRTVDSYSATQDWDLTFRFRQGTTTSNKATSYLYLFYDEDNGEYAARFIVSRYGAQSSIYNYFKVYTRYNGTALLHESNKYNYGSYTTYWVKAQRRGDIFAYKHWQSAASEPSTWDWEGELPQHMISSGKFRHVVQCSNTSWLDDVSLTYVNELGYEKRIAITTSNGVTQCPVEIEKFDFWFSEAYLWTKIPVTYSGIDTDFYLYYDSAQSDNDVWVGEIGSSPGRSVWDNNFVAVWHMNQDPLLGLNAMKDSTVNVNHGTAASGILNMSNVVDGRIYKGIDFDSSDDWLDYGGDASLDVTGNYTLEAIFEGHAATANEAIAGRYDGTNDGFLIRLDADEHIEGVHLVSGTSNVLDSVDPWTSDFHCAALSFETGVGSELWVDGISRSTANTTVSGINSFTRDFLVGNQDSNPPNNPFTGIIDEVRLSNGKRSDAWIKATYYSNQDNLITYTIGPTFFYEGYVTVNAVPAARTVNLYKRDTGQLVDTTTSSGTNGWFQLGSPHDDYHFVVALPDLADNYKILTDDKVHPSGG